LTEINTDEYLAGCEYLKGWVFKVQMWEESMLQELMNMIKHGLVPTVDDDEIVFHIKVNVTYNPNNGKTCFNLSDNPS